MRNMHRELSMIPRFHGHNFRIDGESEDSQLEIDRKAKDVSRVDKNRWHHDVLAAPHHFPLDYVVIARIGVVFRIIFIDYRSFQALNSHADGSKRPRRRFRSLPLRWD